MGRTLGVTHEDAVIMPSPISHASGYLQGVNLPLTVGAKSVLVEHFTAQETLELIGTEKCSFSMGATPFLHDIIEEILKK
ncbi:hypothetical protein QS257_12000 [Terrilactibacillus sp. S3-3]|nr:hypothetical protein QS257_12000 [Terrilactibacillus sp. S3-3]